MECDYCKKEFPDKELGKFKDTYACFQCATDQGIPADFEAFLEDTPLAKEGEDLTLTGTKLKEKGNFVVTFLVSAIFAVGAIWLYVGFPQYRSGYVFLVEGILSGLCIRILQKGRGGNHQNIAAVMVMISFIFPQLQLMNMSDTIDFFMIIRDFIWLTGGVFASYILLVEITPPMKKEKKN